MKIYDKPYISIICYNSIDDINAMTLNTSAVIAPYNKSLGGKSISAESFKLHK